MRKSRLSKKSILAVSAAVCCAPSLALAVQTWTDATGDYAGGSPTAGPPAGDSYMDIANVVVTNNATQIFFQINLATADGGHATNITTDTTQSYGKYLIGIETNSPGASPGSTTVFSPTPDNFPIGISTGENFFIDNWTNATTGGTVANPDTGDGRVFAFTGPSSSGSWGQVAGNGLATDVPGNVAFFQTVLGATSITDTVNLASLGLSVGQQFNFDVWTAYTDDGATDALDSGAAATSISSPTYISPYTYTGYTTTPYDSATAPGTTYSTTIYTVATPSFTWNNTPASAGGDGVTWDTTSYNWNNGIYADIYTDGSNVTFNDNNSGAASYAVTLNTTVSPGSVTVNNSLGNYTITGTGKIVDTGAFTKSGSDTLTIGTALSVGSMSISAGTLKLATGVSGGSGPAITSPIDLTSLSITGTGVLDVNNDHVIITYGASDPFSTIAGYIKSGYNGGNWNGPGIISSAAQIKTNGLSYGLGYADGKDNKVAGLSSGQIEVAYTLLGDANLDGLVNAADFTILAANFNQPVTGWDQGDFNYDGLVNAADFTDLAANFN
ncbi:MAG: dockerin type I repeat-containing protein, partial [Tepidisphaeraceae bacterium]